MSHHDYDDIGGIESLIGRSAILSIRESIGTIERKAIKQRVNELEASSETMISYLESFVSESEGIERKVGSHGAKINRIEILTKVVIILIFVDIISRAFV